VNKAATTTGLTSAPDPSSSGQSVTFTATVSSPAGSPTGTVRFFEGTTLLGTGTVGPGGVATFTTSTLPAGTHTITATYGGDTNFLGSSGTDTQTVNGGGGSDTTPPTITIASPVAGGTYDVATQLTLSYTVTDEAGDTVTITQAQLDGAGPNYASGSTIDTATLAAGVHTFTIAAHDAAGNTATKTVTFRIRATPAGLINLINRLVGHGIASQMQQPLLAKLNAALAAIAAGNTAEAKNDLQSFINLVSAQSGKKIDPAIAAQLIQYASDLLASL
jgi:hypothetical protein